MYLVGKLIEPKAFHNPKMIMQSLMSTLRNLNIAYIDMYIINCPEGHQFEHEHFVDTWYEMEILVVIYLIIKLCMQRKYVVVIL